jgi:hypothetical protein
MSIRGRAVTLLLLMVALGYSEPAHAQAPGSGGAGVDWSSLDLFWRVHDVLAADQEPAAALWDSLFASTGYAALEAREQRAATLRLAFRVAFKPSLSDSIPLVLAGSPWLEHHLPLIAAAPRWRTEVERLRAPAALDALLDSARTLAAQWLPEGATDRLPMGRIGWAIFGSQRGYPDLLLLDPALFVQHPDRARLLGHELHHYYRAGLARPRQPLGGDLAAWALVSVEVEGIAGQVDKRPLLALDSAALARRYPEGTPSGAYYRDYPRVHGESPRWLQMADSLLTELATVASSAERATLAAALHGGLPDNGRALGSWMADVIDDVLGRAAVLEVVGDPFEFWRTYQRAAQSSGGRYPTLSATAMRVIAEIESQSAIETGVLTPEA